MTASIQPETKSPSRRALLAGALGGLGAWAASAIGRASPVRGADGDAVVVGGENMATTPTGFTTSNDGALYGRTNGIGYGVLGNSKDGDGVVGTSDSGIGVSASSSASIAVESISLATNQPASVGRSINNSTGVLGVSGSHVPSARAKTGVYGYAEQDIFASGVLGQSPFGVGVRGKTTGGYAGYFEGRVYTNAFYELGEVATPAAPLAHRARLFVRDNGAGNTQLCVRFPTGSVRVISTEP
jgi:hypothetical protein